MKTSIANKLLVTFLIILLLVSAVLIGYFQFLLSSSKERLNEKELKQTVTTAYTFYSNYLDSEKKRLDFLEGEEVQDDRNFVIDRQYIKTIRYPDHNDNIKMGWHVEDGNLCYSTEKSRTIRLDS